MREGRATGVRRPGTKLEFSAHAFNGVRVRSDAATRSCDASAEAHQ